MRTSSYWCVVISLAWVGAAWAQYPGADGLTEQTAALWGAAATPGQGTASVADDFSRVHDGVASVRFDTTSGFDTWLWAPITRRCQLVPEQRRPHFDVGLRRESQSVRLPG